MKKCYLLFIVSSIFFFSCGKDDSTVDKIWPLKSGNYWTFADSSKNGYDWDVQTITWVVRENVIVDNKSYFAISITNNYPEYSSEIQWLYEFNGSNIISAGAITPTDTIIAKSTMIKNTEEINDSWLFYHVVYSEDDGLYVKDTLDMKLSEMGELSNSEYGLLKYRKYSYNFVIDGECVREINMYFTNNIGPVRLTSLEDGEIISKRSLVEYRIQ